VVACEEALQALFAETACVGGAGVAAQERQRDRAVDVGEARHGAGPEALELAAQLVGDRDAMLDEVLASAGQGAQRLGGIRIGHQHTEAVTVGARQLGEHERVEAVALAARGAEAGSHRGDLVGMDRDHVDPRIQQPFDQQSVGTLDGDQQHPELDQAITQRSKAALVVAIATALHDPPVTVVDADRVLLAGPINASKRVALAHNSSSPSTLTVAGGEVPWRVLTDGALTAQLPVATRGTSTERREALVSRWPSARASDAGALPTSAGTTKDDQ
jgi:hypothetical protein